LGAEGSYKGVHFALIGRIQIKYSQGYWNEWYLLFDDMRTGWLSEAGGEYVLTFARHVLEALPQFAELKIGQRFVLASQPWTVSNIENAECVAGQGELPFKVGAGYPVAAVDLRNGANFATLDYSETPPLLFVGEPVVFASLKMNNLREGMAIPTATVEAQVFRCPSCGAPMQARSKDILAVGCVTCGAVVDTADRNYKLLSQALGMRDEKYTPRLPLGSKGTLEGKPVEVIAGFEFKEDCWLLRFAFQRFQTTTASNTTNFYIQLELTGLTSVGTNALSQLQRNIPGYQRISPLPRQPGMFEYYE